MSARYRIIAPLIVSVFGILPACKPSPGPGPITPPSGEAFGGKQCSVERGLTEPDLMGWDPASRLNLKRLRSEGIVAVRFEATGCNVALEVLPNCIATGTYGYTPYAANERKVAHDANELYAKLPVGAASLTGKVAGEHSLRTDYMLVGQYALPAGTMVARSDLTGPGCTRATHVVSAVYVGGFAMVAGDSRTIEATAKVFGAGIGGSNHGDLEHLADEGNAAACDEAQRTEKPKATCDVPLRLALLPVGSKSTLAPKAAAAPKPIKCPAGMSAIPGGAFTTLHNRMFGSEPTIVEPSCLDPAEVTTKEYGACVDKGKCQPPVEWSAMSVNQFCNWKNPEDRSTHPINCVDRKQAAAYCAFVGKRLPDTDQWEFAGRAGDKGFDYPWGNERPTAKTANLCDPECLANRAKKLNYKLEPGRKLLISENDGFPETAPVRSFPATAFGLFDMSGNVQEWTTRHGKDGPARGASYATSGAYSTSDSSTELAHDYPLDGAYDDVGFRCASDPL